jgi:uncharacterized membrane protein
MTNIHAESGGQLVNNTYYRSLTKAITWRMIGTMDTIVLSYLITGSSKSALSIGFTELATKTLFYFVHERIWNKIRWKGGLKTSRLRSFYKSVSWRLVGTMDTILIALFFTGDPLSAFTIGGVETLTKVALYYLHERVWHKVKWGLNFNN